MLENRAYRESLEERVSEQARRLEELFLASVQSLAEALELKDPYTRGHSVRVSQYSSAIAGAMGLGGEMLRQIELGGHVHDIGKIGVREAVLNKAERLTAEEYEHIMTHPVLGWRILAPLLGERRARSTSCARTTSGTTAAACRTVCMGTEIPLEARIVAVADALDAMTSDRPYRPCEMSLREAIDEIRRNALDAVRP